MDDKAFIILAHWALSNVISKELKMSCPDAAFVDLLRLGLYWDFEGLNPIHHHVSSRGTTLTLSSSFLPTYLCVSV